MSSRNLLSRKILEHLYKAEGKVRFEELVKVIGAEERLVYNNLFYLEENGLVELSKSYPSDAVYPLIHFIHLRAKGKRIVENPQAMEELFPLEKGPEVQKPKSFAQVFSEFEKLIAREDKDFSKSVKPILKKLKSHPLSRKLIE